MTDHLCVVIQTIVAVIGLAIVPLTLGFIAVQTRIAARATRAQVFQNIASGMIEIDRYFVDHPEYKPYFGGDKDIDESDPEHSRVLAIAEWIMDWMDNSCDQGGYISPEPRSSWYCYFRDLMSSSPIMRRFWEENRAWYSEPLRRVLDEAATL